ncbi:hypothetical protein EH223_08890 [candidate division KSB1 bacterium]|nr:DUF5320 domain-containing protein [candidate division KSB1 bacterium]RQW03837.1 MAG: hypothetical protein EH223_08890 [candidate division KSB1 bacterium]
MPFGDRTGPFGEGPMTGRGAGYCAGYGMPGNANPFGRGMGFGRRGGWGRGFRFFYGRGARPRWGWGVPWTDMAAPTKEEELEMLKNQAESLRHGLEEIERRMQELETKAEK